MERTPYTLCNENSLWKRKKKKMMSGSTAETVSALVYIEMENKYRLNRFREFEIMPKFQQSAGNHLASPFLDIFFSIFSQNGLFTFYTLCECPLW